MASDWMAELPPSLTAKPLCHLKLPGSHDSGANHTLNTSLPVANDSSVFIQKAGRIKWIRSGIKRWAITQRKSILEQLELGIRYLDLRISLPPKAVRENLRDFRLVHALYGEKLSDELIQVKQFLEDHPGEVILLDINHLYNIDSDTYFNFKMVVENTLGEKIICPVMQPLQVSLDYLRKNGYRVIVFSRFLDSRPTLFWTSSSIMSPWPNTNRLFSMLEFLKKGLDFVRPKNMNVFYVTQGVLTAEMKDVVRHWTSSLEHQMALNATHALLQWLITLNEKQRSQINVVIVDFVDVTYTKHIISMNYTTK